MSYTNKNRKIINDISIATNLIKEQSKTKDKKYTHMNRKIINDRAIENNLIK